MASAGSPETVEAAQLAIHAHNDAYRLEPDQGAAVDLFHLLYSLLDWAEENHVDFDAELQNVRDEYRQANDAA